MANPLQVGTLFGELQGNWADTKQHIRVFKGSLPPSGRIALQTAPSTTQLAGNA